MPKNYGESGGAQGVVVVLFNEKIKGKKECLLRAGGVGILE